MTLLRYLSILILTAVVTEISLGESQYGIMRTTFLSEFPDVPCFERTLKDVTKIRSVETRVLSERPSARRTRFRYEGEGFWAFASIAVQANGRILFVHERRTINEEPSRNELIATREIMIEVEQLLASRCDVGELRKGIDERWFGVEAESP